MHFLFTVSKDEQDRSAAEVLRKRYNCSRILLKKIRLEGSLTVNGIPHRMKDPLAAGDQVEALYQDPRGECPEKLELPSDLPALYEDAFCLLVSKPPRLVTHPTYLHQADSLTARLHAPLRPVSRLDRDTSGIVLLAKSGYAHHVLSQCPLQKNYFAYVHGSNLPWVGFCSESIRRAEDSIILREVHAEGKKACSYFEVECFWPDAQVTLLRYTLLTGRTHQIRLHSLHCGWPLLGESLYGCGRYHKDWPLRRRYSLLPDSEERADLKKAQEQADGFHYLGRYDHSKARYGDLEALRPSDLNWDQVLNWDQKMERQALHARQVKFLHPWTQQSLNILADLPEDLKKLEQALDQKSIRIYPEQENPTVFQKKRQEIQDRLTSEGWILPKIC